MAGIFHSFDIGTIKLYVGYPMLKTAVVSLCALAFAYFKISDKYCNKDVNAEFWNSSMWISNKIKNNINVIEQIKLH